MNENNDKKGYDENKQLYSDIVGTGPISTMIFTIILIVAMYIVSKFMGN